MMEQRGEKQQGGGDKNPVEDHGQTGLGPGLQVDGRTGEGTAGRISLEKSTADIGHPLADQFLIGVDALLGLAGHGLGHGDGLHEGHQGNDQGGGQQVQNGIEAEGGQTETKAGRREWHRPPRHRRQASWTPSSIFLDATAAIRCEPAGAVPA
jgi:hypothetical protein